MKKNKGELMKHDVLNPLHACFGEKVENVVVMKCWLEKLRDLRSTVELFVAKILIWANNNLKN